MGELLDADRDGLRLNGGSLDQVAGTVKKILDRHHAAVDAIGDCWGDDTVGKEFAGKYEPSRDEFDQYADKLVDALCSSADSVRDSAHRLDRTEHDNTWQG